MVTGLSGGTYHPERSGGFSPDSRGWAFRGRRMLPLALQQLHLDQRQIHVEFAVLAVAQLAAQEAGAQVPDLVYPFHAERAAAGRDVDHKPHPPSHSSAKPS